MGDQMVTRSKRVLLSFASVIVSTVVCLVGMLIVNAIGGNPATYHSSEVILTIAVVSCLSSIGWLITLPVVFMVGNIRGWRFLAYWILGSCVGPLLMVALFAAVYFIFPQSPNATWFHPEYMPIVYLAAAISSLASLIYLVLLRRTLKTGSSVPSTQVAGS